MTYPEFHRRFKLTRRINKIDRIQDTVYKCIGKCSKFVAVPKRTRSGVPTSLPVSTSFLTPSRHGEDFYYQQLLLRRPFREATPVALISGSNVSGSLQEECELRGIFEAAETYVSAYEQTHNMETSGVRGVQALVTQVGLEHLFSAEKIAMLLQPYRTARKHGDPQALACPSLISS